ncbi:MAG: formyltransferase family protein [bacterium]|nr:formyltransferase family protein [bacterium]
MDEARLAVGVSGEGTTLTAIAEAEIPVAFVFADRLCRALDIIAPRFGIPTVLIHRTDFGPTFDQVYYSERVVDKLRERGVTHIALAGFKTILARPMCKQYKDRMINSHPSLLPKFPGAHAVRDTFAAWKRDPKTRVGCSVHKVVAQVDAEEILAQSEVWTYPQYTEQNFRERIQDAERLLYPPTIKLLLAGEFST